MKSLSMTIRSPGVRALAAAGLASAFVLTPTGPVWATGPRDCSPDAQDLFITYQPVSHSTDATHFTAHVTVSNQGRRCALPSSGWRLYFNFVRQPLAVYPADSPLGMQGRQQLAGQGLSVTRADEAQSGDLYVLAPTAGFAPIPAGHSRTITLDAEYWSLLKTDAPAGWSIAFGHREARWVPAKALQDPTDPAQVTAFSGDQNPVETAATRFAENTATKQSLSLKQRIVPQPLVATAAPGRLTLDSRHLTISAPHALSNEADYLKSALGDVLRGRVSLNRAGRGDKVITLRINPRLDVDRDGKADDEGYTLSSTGRGVRIVGKDRAGVLHGIQTLRQMIPISAYKEAAHGAKVRAAAIPRATISDAPLFGYRGMGIDVGRHFQTKQTIEKFLDLMSLLKLNKLHFHLTDDEGWRLEIPGIPELTSYGSKRGLDLAENQMLHQAMGSGNDLNRGDKVAGKARNETQANLGRAPAYQGFEQDTLNFVGAGAGYYSTRDFQQILRYAQARHISVIPEFDFPAHARAAVQSMERRYERYRASDPARANQYRLLDPQDTSHHVSVQYYTDNMANPCIPSTYRFLGKVVREVEGMYERAGVPLTMLNLGGDEPPGPNRWQGSPACAANPETAGMDDHQLQDYFFTKWNAIALTVAPKTAGWEDILIGGTGNLSLEDFVPLPWQNVWGWGVEQAAYKFANKGIPVILAHATNLYMDLAYNKDPNEPGYYWANFVDDESTFTYQPFNVYANATHDRWGAPFTPDPSWEQLTAAGKRNILGMEANLWAENGKTPEIREYQAFPKLLGVAERAWYKATPTPAQMPAAWSTFVNTVGQVTFPLLSYYKPVGLKEIGVNYRIPLPGGRISGGLLTANVRNPGLPIQYSTDGVRWHRYRGPVQVGSAALLRSRAVDGRTSRLSPLGLPAWAAGVAYPADALITYNGEIFRAKQAHRSQAASTPDSIPGTWALLQ